MAHEGTDALLAASGFHLVDDGTMDTVLACKECGEHVRANPDTYASTEGYSDGGDAYTDEELEYMRIEEAIDIAESHFDECKVLTS